MEHRGAGVKATIQDQELGPCLVGTLPHCWIVGFIGIQLVLDQLSQQGIVLVLPPIPHSWILLQGGTQGCDLLCQAFQYRILHLRLVRAVEALERVSGVQGIHLGLIGEKRNVDFRQRLDDFGCSGFYQLVK